MGKLSMISAREIIAFLESLGFECVRQKCSHKFFRHNDGRTATIPDHKGEDLGKGILSRILRDIEVSKSEFEEWTKKKR
jgi:predicted RNA binding protein YcfA (HicA-like mRNA interferase family)